MKPTATILIGHRGVGKSTLLRQLASPISAQQGGPLHFFDLDQEIQKKTGKKISELFQAGEAQFRQVETQTLNEIVKKSVATGDPVLIAAGAGIESLPAGVHVIWLRRSSDKLGRVFSDRPRLNAKLPPFAEYMERFEERDQRYRHWCDEELWLPEGYESGLEEFFGDQQDWLLPYELTLLPENFKNWTEFWTKRKNWGLRHVEVRDDLLTPEQIDQVIRDVPAEHIVFSHRKLTADNTNATRPFAARMSAKMITDWALELGHPPPEANIISLHERQADLQTSLSGLTAAALTASASVGTTVIAKLAVEIHEFSELELAHRWWQESPSARAFLPRSRDGRWRWYRALFGRKMPIHFFREGGGSGLDQPMLWESIHQPMAHKHFAAVLGHPVEHSRSPLEHYRFFKEQGLPVVAIDVHEHEWDRALDVLRDLGLAFAAVTAPLKLKAGASVDITGPINTLWLQGGKFNGANTDVQALQNLAEEFSSYKNVWLWGAGAMSANVQAAFPSTKVISAREGTADLNTPDLLVWAAGRTREFKWPPNTPNLKLVLDLNYGDDSPGLELAVTRNYPYQSGLRLFKLQAELQRQIWREHLEKL